MLHYEEQAMWYYFTGYCMKDEVMLGQVYKGSNV